MRTDPVAAAMRAAPRADYLPEGARGRAADDVPISIGHGATCSQPSTVATMLRALHAGPGHRVLDVGAGSGWTTALLAHVVGPAGRVVGVELETELAEAAEARLRRDGLDHACVLAVPPGVLGRAEDGPFDRILVSAMAQQWPAALEDQLADAGRMVLPWRGRLMVAERAGEEVRRDQEPGWYRFVPLR